MYGEACYEVVGLRGGRSGRSCDVVPVLSFSWSLTLVLLLWMMGAVLIKRCGMLAVRRYVSFFVFVKLFGRWSLLHLMLSSRRRNGTVMLLYVTS